MMKKRLAILAFALLPLAASAQTAPTRTPGGPGGAPGIAVTGHGAAKFTVKTLGFVATARGAAADESSVIAAMRAAGIDDPVVGPNGPQLYSGNQTTLRGTIRDVTRAKLERIALAAGAYVRMHEGASIDNVSFFPRLEDCAAQEQVARVAAMADARRKAQAIAGLAEVTIENVLAVSESGGCPAGPDASYGNVLSFDLATLTASVTLSEIVTFSTVAGAPSTRRRAL